MLVGESYREGGKIAAARVVVPPGGGRPEHDHGESAALVVVQGGRVMIREGGREETLPPGRMASIGVGERASLGRLCTAVIRQSFEAWPPA